MTKIFKTADPFTRLIEGTPEDHKVGLEDAVRLYEEVIGSDGPLNTDNLLKYFHRFDSQGQRFLSPLFDERFLQQSRSLLQSNRPSSLPNPDTTPLLHDPAPSLFEAPSTTPRENLQASIRLVLQKLPLSRHLPPHWLHHEASMLASSQHECFRQQLAHFFVTHEPEALEMAMQSLLSTVDSLGEISLSGDEELDQAFALRIKLCETGLELSEMALEDDAPISLESQRLTFLEKLEWLQGLTVMLEETRASEPDQSTVSTAHVASAVTEDRKRSGTDPIEHGMVAGSIPVGTYARLMGNLSPETITHLFGRKALSAFPGRFEEVRYLLDVMRVKPGITRDRIENAWISEAHRFSYLGKEETSPDLLRVERLLKATAVKIAAYHGDTATAQHLLDLSRNPEDLTFVDTLTAVESAKRAGFHDETIFDTLSAAFICSKHVFSFGEGITPEELLEDYGSAMRQALAHYLEGRYEDYAAAELQPSSRHSLDWAPLERLALRLHRDREVVSQKAAAAYERAADLLEKIETQSPAHADTIESVRLSLYDRAWHLATPSQEGQALKMRTRSKLEGIRTSMPPSLQSARRGWTSIATDAQPTAVNPCTPTQHANGRWFPANLMPAGSLLATSGWTSISQLLRTMR